MGILGAILNIGGKVVGQAVKQYDNQLNDAYRSINNKERANMSSEQKEKLSKAKERIEKQRNAGRSIENNINSLTSVVNDFSGAVTSDVIGEKSINEWDREWKSIGSLKTCSLTPYNHSVGLYRMVISGETKYVGRAIELNNGGFRKRLSDYRRDSDSARIHASGSTINQNIDKIEVYILVVGNDQEAVNNTRKLEGKFIAKYNPEWNKQKNI